MHGMSDILSALSDNPTAKERRAADEIVRLRETIERLHLSIEAMRPITKAEVMAAVSRVPTESRMAVIRDVFRRRMEPILDDPSCACSGPEKGAPLCPCKMRELNLEFEMTGRLLEIWPEYQLISPLLSA